MNTFQKQIKKFIEKVNDDTIFYNIQTKLRTLSIQKISSCNLIIDSTDSIDRSINYTNFQISNITKLSSFHIHIQCTSMSFSILSHLTLKSFVVLSIKLIRKEISYVKNMLCQGHKNLSLSL